LTQIVLSKAMALRLSRMSQSRASVWRRRWQQRHEDNGVRLTVAAEWQLAELELSSAVSARASRTVVRVFRTASIRAGAGDAQRARAGYADASCQCHRWYPLQNRVFFSPVEKAERPPRTVGAHARENSSAPLAAAGSASLLEDSIVRVGFRKVSRKPPARPTRTIIAEPPGRRSGQTRYGV